MALATVLLVVTSVIAVVALVAAVVAVRTLREVRASLDAHQVDMTDAVALADHQPQAIPLAEYVRPPELEPRVVEGRVIVPPTQSQVVRTALGRPGVRLSVFAHGLARALRAENRDRIVALMRREYRHRRNERLRAGWQAVRAARPTSAPSTDRLHARLSEPLPPSLSDRMIRS